MAKPIALLSQPGLMESGIYPDLDPLVVPFWIDAVNVNFRESSVEKMAGYAAIFDNFYGREVPFNINGMLEFFTKSDQRNIWFGGDSLGLIAIFREASAAAELVTPDKMNVGPGKSGYWSFTQWGNSILGCRGGELWFITAAYEEEGMGLSDVVSYKITAREHAPEDIDGFTLVPAPFRDAEIVRVIGKHIVVFNTDQGETRWNWCSADDPLTWGADIITNTAGADSLLDGSSRINAAEKFNEGLAFYTSSRMYFLEFIGGDFVLGYRPLVEGIGAIGKNCVVPVGNYHYGFGPLGFWKTDGVQIQYIDDNIIKDYWRNRIDLRKSNQIIGSHNNYKSQIEWTYVRAPTQEELDDLEPDEEFPEYLEVLVYNYINNTWTRRDYGFDYTISSDLFSARLAVKNDVIYQLETGVNSSVFSEAADGFVSGPLFSRVTSKPLDFGARYRYKWIDSVQVQYKTTGFFQIRFGFSSEAINPLDEEQLDYATFEWTPFVPLAETLPIKRDTRYLYIQIQSATVDADWNVSAIDVYGVVSGTVI